MRSLNRVLFPTILGFLLAMVMLPHWWFWWAVALMVSMVVISAVAWSKRPKPVEPWLQAALDAVGPNPQAQAFVRGLNDVGCRMVVELMDWPDERESTLDLMAWSGANDNRSADATIDILTMRWNRLRSYRRVVFDVGAEFEALAESLDDVTRRHELHDEQLSYREFATWSRTIAVRTARKTAEGHDTASKADYLDDYIAELEAIRLGNKV